MCPDNHQKVKLDKEKDAPRPALNSSAPDDFILPNEDGFCNRKRRSASTCEVLAERLFSA